MVHEIDVEVGVFVEDELTIGRALVIERIVRDRGECRLQTGKSLQGRLRSWVFLAVQRQAAVLAIDWYEALVEMSALDGGGRALLAFQGEFIDILPRDAFQRRYR